MKINLNNTQKKLDFNDKLTEEQPAKVKEELDKLNEELAKLKDKFELQDNKNKKFYINFEK